MRSILKKVIPRAWRPSIKQKLADWNIRRAIRPLRRNACLTASELKTLRKAWGNEYFSADLQYLAETMRLIRDCKGPILECGTGVTTISAAVLAERLDLDVFCLEQDPAWSLPTRRALAFNNLNRVRIFEAPLRSYGDYVWYDAMSAALPKHFGLVICDGPYVDDSWGAAIHQNWRYGTLPFMRSTQSTFEVLLLDDVDDPRASGVLDRWHAEFKTQHETISTREGAYAIVRAA